MVILGADEAELKESKDVETVRNTDFPQIR